MDMAYRGIIERVAEAEREDAQRQHGPDSLQRVSVAEGENERGGQQPQRGQTVDVRGITEKRVPLALTAPRNRIDRITDGREQRQTITQYHTMSRALQRTGRVMRLKTGQNGNT